MTKIIIPDSNVFAKIFAPELDADEAKIFFKTCEALNAKLFVPHLFKYEIAEITRYHKGSIAKTRALFQDFENTMLTVVDPDEQAWKIAEDIVKSGNEKSGYPSIYDSIYHALAIRLGGTFLTADKRHFAKSQNYGHISLLQDWEQIFA